MLKQLKKQGFTLVELLVTIVLLGIVAAIVIYNMTNVSNTTKETDYKRYIAAIKSAADVYATNNPDAFNDLYESKSYVYLTVGDLVRSGLLDENLKNPYTDEKVAFDDRIKANLSNDTGDIIFVYPIDNEEEETFLVSVSDYVMWGEGYDCMQGAGSYLLSLSDEKGNLIMLDNQDNIDKYNFKCSLPDGFNPEEAGNYDVQYTWLTESGTKKTATRTLKVLPKAVPSFKTNYDYFFEEDVWFTPSLLGTGETQDPNCPTGWKCLTYTPYIEGTDPSATSYKITKKGNNPETQEDNVTDGFISTYEAIRADDGDKTYFIQAIVQGHYNKSYTYTVDGSERIKMKLIIPESYIATTSSIVGTSQTYNIKEAYSPVGIKEYEYKLLKSNEKADNESGLNDEKLFDKTGEVTPKLVDILGGVCLNEEITYPKIAFRAINKENFVGDWTEIDANLSNNVSTIIASTSNGCTSPSKCCLKSGSSCYFNEKVMHLSYGGRKFITLERYNNGEMLAAYEGVNQRVFSPHVVTKKTWTIQMCDGVFTANYTLSSPVLQTIINESNLFGDSMLPKNYTSVLKNTTWPAQDGRYTSYIGTVDTNMVQRYGHALYDNNRYWTTSTYNDPDRIVRADDPYDNGGYTSVHDSYFYTVYNGQLSTAYGGNRYNLKPLVQFRNVLYTCSGDGSASNPFVVAS